MQKTYFGILLGICSLVTTYAQTPLNTSVVFTDESSGTTQTTVSTTQVIEGSPFDTAVFDSTIKIPFKLHEWRGEEMIHNWVSLGAPRAPHLYLGAGFYHFYKTGMSDVQIGWYPLVYPRTWEFYFAAQQMFFLYKKSKVKKTGLCLEHRYTQYNLEHYSYQAPLRRDKFYGITTGFAYEGMPNVKKRVVYLYKDLQDQQGELHDVILKQYTSIHIHAGLSKMRCRNAEYEAPRKKDGVFRVSSMSRMTLGTSYYPVMKVEVLLDSGYTTEFLHRAATQPDFSFFFSWEGRTAIMNMKRECGFHANCILTYKTWNRETEDPISLVLTWGMYFSLDKKSPNWKQKQYAGAHF